MDFQHKFEVSEISIITKAKNFAKHKHDGYKRDNGEDYYESHCLQVYNILQNITSDKEILCAGLLHDTIEDTNTTYEEIASKFGSRVADLVMEVTHAERKDYFPKLKTIDGILIKFADRLSNLSEMTAWNEKEINQYIKRSKFWKDGSEYADK